MTDNILPPDNATDNGNGAAIPPETPDDSNANQVPDNPGAAHDDDLGPRLERLGGEPAPDITPEEFARLQQAGQIHIDPRGRVRTTQRNETDAGVSLRKRRAWYSPE